MNGKYVGYVAGEDPAARVPEQDHADRLQVRERELAFRVFRLCGSNEVYGYQEKFSGTKVICKFYGTRFRPDLDKAACMARQEYDGLQPNAGADSSPRWCTSTGQRGQISAPFG